MLNSPKLDCKASGPVKSISPLEHVLTRVGFAVPLLFVVTTCMFLFGFIVQTYKRAM